MAKAWVGLFEFARLFLLFHLVAASIAIAIAIAQEEAPLYPPLCNTGLNYSRSSAYATNLELTLRSLAANASFTGFYSTSWGSNPDQVVYGLVQCRGDVSPQECQVCANSSSSEILERCQYQKEAVVFYDKCWLRYAPYRFLSEADTEPRVYLWNANDVLDPAHFTQKMGELMNNLSSAAASSSSLRFASGMTSFMGSVNIYGLAQCSRDLSESSCFSCLQRMITYIPTCCEGKQGGRVYSKSCNIRFEVYSFFQYSPPPPPPPPSPSSPSPPPSPTLNSTQTKTDGGEIIHTFIIPIAAGAVAATVLTSTICICVLRKNKTRAGDVKDKNVESLLFDFKTLRAATNNFCHSNKLGQGGFGPVYKGKLFDGRQIAVKRLSQTSGQGLEELKTEVLLVAKLLHKNLVRLLGFCLEKEEKLLVYEYLPNGSLDHVLFDESKRLLLDWDIRYKIIVGIARGLLYLHHDSQIRIIHRDLKVSNILLDEEMNPKISDFGLARLFCGSQTQANTNRIAGTFGYMAPEYAKNGHFSTKSDVFSFGVLILEIVTGRKNSSFRDSGNLLTYAWQHWIDGTTSEMMDETLGDEWIRSESLKCIHIGLLCVQHDASDRPTMSELILMLNNYTFTCPVPSRPAYVKTSNKGAADVLTEADQSSIKISVNEVTISELEPR